MRVQKKLFKHGGSLAMVMPSEFIKRLKAHEVVVELSFINGKTPKLTITPTDSFDTIENDPIFALFAEAILRDAMEHPQDLLKTEDIWNEKALRLLEGVETSDNE